MTYIGTNVGGMAKGRSAGHKGDVSALIGQSHLQINADGDRDEFTQEEVADRIKKSSGANYDLGSNDGGGNYTTQVPLYLLWLYSLWLYSLCSTYDGGPTYTSQAGAIGKAAADKYHELEKETTIAPVKYETFARPKETPIDLGGRPMVASAT